LVANALKRARSFCAEPSSAWSWAFFRLRLIERSLEQARIDLGDHVTLLDVLSLGEQHLLQLAVDLGVDADAQDRLHRAQTREVDRHIPSGRGRHAHRNGSAAGSTGAPGIGSLGAAAIPINGSAPANHDGKDQGSQSVAPTPPRTS
jgi:hypothetical protein